MSKIKNFFNELTTGKETMFKKIVIGIRNLLKEAARVLLFLVGISIIVLTLLYPGLPMVFIFGRIISLIGGCLGTFFICLAYGMGYFDVRDKNSLETHPALQKAIEDYKLNLESQFKLKQQAADSEDELNREIRKLKEKLKEKTRQKLREKTKELEEILRNMEQLKFQIREKDEEIKRLNSMKGNIESMKVLLKLTLFEETIRQLDIAKYYLDEGGNRIPENKVTTPTGSFINKKESYDEYYGITNWEYELEGSVDLSKVKVWEEKGSIYFTEVNINEPKPNLSKQPEQLLAQLRRIKLTKKGKELKKNKEVERLIDDDYLKGEKEQQDEFRKKLKPIFDEKIERFIKQSAENFIKGILAQSGKPVVYLPDGEGQPLVNYLSNTLKEIEQQQQRLNLQYQEKEKALIEYKDNDDVIDMDEDEDDDDDSTFNIRYS